MKTKSILLIVAGILLVIGIIIGTVGLTLGGTQMAWETFTEYTQDFSSDLSEIKFDLNVSNVKIERSASDKITVIYNDNERHHYNLNVENNTLRVERNELGVRKWFEYINLWNNFEKYTVTLLLPDSFKGALNIKTTTGDINLRNIAIEADAVFTGTTGKISIDTLSANNVTFTTTTGNVYGKNIKAAGNINCSATVGSASLEESSVSGLATMRSTTGSIRVYDTQVTGDFDCTATTGTIRLEKLSAASCLAKATTGSVKVDRLYVLKDASLEATTGSIHATICGKADDFNVSVSKSSAANSNIDSANLGKEKNLALKTSVGSINISFVA